MLSLQEFYQIPLFSSVSPDEISDVYSTLLEFAMDRYTDKCILQRQNAKPEHLHILLQGAAKLKTVNIEGREHVIAVEKSGSVLTQILQLVTQAPYTAQIIITQPSRILSIPRREILVAMDRYPSFYRTIMQAILGRAASGVPMNEILRLNSARNRICSYLLLVCKEENNFVFYHDYSISELADTLALSRTAFSKELHALEKMKLIRIGQNCLQLLDPAALEALML